MPNWCMNTVTLTHNDINMINRAIESSNNNRLFNEFVPRPSIEEDNWYDWNLINWGTKWDMTSFDEVESDGTNSISISFQTAWCPPIEFYNSLIEQGFEVSAYYYEGGCGFCGHYDNGSDDYYTIEGNSKWVKEYIPEHINEVFAISDFMEDFEDDEDV